jgi:hypothetical protein
MSIPSDLLQRLLALVSGGQAVTVLKEIVTAAFGAGGIGNAEAKALAYLNGRLNAQEARSAGKLLAHTTLKLGEDAMGANAALTLEQRVAVGQALFQNGALQMTNAAAAFLALGDAQAALEQARGTAGEDAAREAREAAEAAYTKACVNIGRAVAGAATQ